MDALLFVNRFCDVFVWLKECYDESIDATIIFYNNDNVFEL